MERVVGLRGETEVALDGKMSRALTLGILADWLEGEYQSAVVGGAVDAARESGVNLVLLADSMLRASFRDGERHNVVYDLARSNDFDGLLVMAGPIANNLGVDDLSRFCERYRPLPMCSVAAPLAGMTAILVDGAPALREGIRHLAVDHRYRRIAFLGGPTENPEACDRLRTYSEAMAVHGLDRSDSLVVIGEFRYESGAEGVRILIDERGITPDAIVAASDPIALGAIDALRARNLRVPHNVAVLGFDDISEAGYSAPPLTTIRQPLRRTGRLALDVLLRRIRGEPVDDLYVLPAELVVRRSCGCYSDPHRLYATGGLAVPVPAAAPGRSVEDLLRERRPRILEAMREAVVGLPDGFAEGWEARLLDALIVELGSSSDGFTERVNALLKEVMLPGATGNSWHPALSALYRELMPCLLSDTAMSSRAESLLQEAEILVAEAVEENQVHHRLMSERRRRSLTGATELLSSAVDLESLGRALRDSLPRLGVPSAYLVLDEDASGVGPRVAFAHDPARDAKELEVLRTAPIVGTGMPPGLLPSDRAYTLVVEPLFFKDESLGYAVFEMGPRDAFTYDAFGALRVQISGALKVALLIEELQVRVGQLRQAQKMETLGQLSGAIAHDFNNLLQAIRGYAELAGIADAGSVELAADLQEIVRAADRASQLTRQLLTFSQPTRANVRVVDVNECVNQAIPMIRRLLGPTIQLTPVLGPEAGRIVVDPAQLDQAIVNLCVNARDAMPDGGTVIIETGRRKVEPQTPSRTTVLHTNRQLSHPDGGAMTFVAVQDAGAGIDPQIKDRIFEPFFTTKDAGQGTGLGLSIVYGIVRSASGDITVESEPGRGTRLSLLFPASVAVEEATVEGPAQLARGTELILLLEDEEPIRKLAERMLGDAGYRVLSAANAVEARELWTDFQNSVDLLLTDVTMPGLSGIAFAAELAGYPRPPRTLFISGRLPGEPGGPALPEGAVFLAKPFSVTGLLDAVRSVLDAQVTA
jgi:signal transduction histidine kinase/DNA-binding LacI/PurR family transcriptional regulator